MGRRGRRGRRRENGSRENGSVGVGAMRGEEKGGEESQGKDWRRQQRLHLISERRNFELNRGNLHNCEN